MNQQLYAKTAIGTVSTANSSLNGSGTIAKIFTAANDGATVSSITIKAFATTTIDIVRVFVSNGQSYSLLFECFIPAVTQDATQTAFGMTIPLDFDLATGCSIGASTETGQTYNVIVSATEWINCPC